MALCLTVRPDESIYLYLPDGREVTITTERRTKLIVSSPRDVVINRIRLDPSQVKEKQDGKPVTRR